MGESPVQTARMVGRSGDRWWSGLVYRSGLVWCGVVWCGWSGLVDCHSWQVITGGWIHHSPRGRSTLGDSSDARWIAACCIFHDTCSSKTRKMRHMINACGICSSQSGVNDDRDLFYTDSSHGESQQCGASAHVSCSRFTGPYLVRNTGTGETEKMCGFERNLRGMWSGCRMKNVTRKRAGVRGVPGLCSAVTFKTAESAGISTRKNS